MIQRILFVLLAVLATIVGIYPGIYFIIDRRFGLLNSKTEELLASNLWNINFYTHIVLGGIAILIGWTQFVGRWRRNSPKIHRQIGKVYVVAVLLSALSGLYIGFFATGGIIPASGFITMAIFWFYSTLSAFIHIKNGRVPAHQKMMVYSYATCLAALTLRVYLPLLQIGLGNFETAYKLVAWLCWVPNVIVAYIFMNKFYPTEKRSIPTPISIP